MKMEHSLGRTVILLGFIAVLVTQASGIEFCTGEIPNSLQGTVRSGSYPDFGDQAVGCICTLRNSNPFAIKVDISINFDVEDYNDPCNQRLVFTRGNSEVNVCPNLDTRIHEMQIFMMASGTYMLQTLGTAGKRWSLQFSYKADAEVTLTCGQGNNDTNPTCPCAWGTGSGGPAVGQAGGDDLGQKLGIGFGTVFGILAVVAIILLVLFLMKRWRSNQSETKEAPSSDHMSRRSPEPLPAEKRGYIQEDNPVIMDPMKVPPGGYPLYADVGVDPRNTNMGYTPDEHIPGVIHKSNDSGLNSMNNSRDNVNDRPPSYYQSNSIPPQPVNMAPDPSALYARPNHGRQPNRLSLTGQGDTGSNDMLYPYRPATYDNEIYVTDNSSHNTSQNFAQTEV